MEKLNIIKKYPLLPITCGCIAGIIAHLFEVNTYILLISTLMAIYIIIYLFYRKSSVPAIILLFSALTSIFSYSYSQKIVSGRITAVNSFNNLNNPVLTLELTDCPLDVNLPDASNSNAKRQTFPHIGKIIAYKSRGKNTAAKIPANTKVRFFSEKTGLKPGDIIRAKFYSSTVRRKAYEGAFSSDKNNEKYGVAISGRIYNPEILEHNTSFNLNRMLFNFRSILVKKSLENFDENEGAFIATVLLGYRENLSTDLKRIFRKTGTGHLLAISGLHVGLIAAAAWFLAMTLSKSKRMSAAFAIFSSLIYLGISGGRPSAVRAAIMVSIYLGGFLFYRKGKLINSLCCAALVILLTYPPTISDPGFLLSFVAVIFISRLAHEFEILNLYLRRISGKKERPVFIPPKNLKDYATIYLHKIWHLLLLSIAAFIGLWPLSAYYFKMLAFSGLFLNIIAIPLLPIILIGGIIAEASLFLPGYISSFVVAVCQYPASVMIGLNEFFAGFDSLILPVNPPDWDFTIFYYSMFFIFFIRSAISLKTRFAVSGILISTVLIISSMFCRDAELKQNFKISIIPAFSSENVVIENNNNVSIFGKLIYGGLDIASFLRHNHIEKIDSLDYFSDTETPDENDYSKLLEQYSDFRINNIVIKNNSPDRKDIINIPETKFSIKIIRNKSGTAIAYVLQGNSLNILITEKYWLKSMAYHLKKSIKQKINLTIIKSKKADDNIMSKYYAEIMDNINPDVVFVEPFLPVFKKAQKRSGWGTIQILQTKQGNITISGFDGEEWKVIDKLDSLSDNK